MRLVGLTGGIATGKTTVSNLLREKYHFIVIDLDQLSRIVVQPGKPANKKIREFFGDSVFLENGELDRKKLSKIVFDDPEARKKINQATHSAIFQELLKQLLYYFIIGTNLVILDSPLLFETGLAKFMSQIIVVWTTPESQLQRLMKRDNYSEEEALKRIQSQMPVDKKKELATYVIDNSKDLTNTSKQVDYVSSQIRPGLVFKFIKVVLISTSIFFMFKLTRSIIQ